MSSSEQFEECNRYFKLNEVTLYTLFAIATVFLIVISMLTRRSRFRLHAWNGRPGPVIPLNLLDGFENRYAHAVAFVVAANRIIDGLIVEHAPVQGKTNNSINRYLKIPLKILEVVLIATSAYPLFVCIGMRNRLLGSLIGLLFTATWLFMNGSFIIGVCAHCRLLKGGSAFMIFYYIPLFIALIWLFIFFAKRIFFHWRDRPLFSSGNVEIPKDSGKHMYSYVANLFKKKKKVRMATPPISVTDRCIKVIKDIYMYRPMPEFKFSTRIMCTFAVCLVALYMVTAYIIFIAKRNPVFVSLQPLLQSELDRIYNIFLGCYYFAAIFSLFISCLLMKNILQCHRENIMRLRIGDRSWLPPSMERYECCPTKLTFASMKYAGYQIGYFIIGYLYRFIYFWLVPAVIFSAATFSRSWKAGLEYLPLLVMVLALYILQRLLAKFAFVQKKDGTAIINNRKAFNIFAYYMIFYNAILGSLHATLRVVTGLVIGVLYFERMQKSILPKTFESFDKGYRAYIGYLQIEHTFSNPVLRAFVYLLKDREYNRERTATASSLESGTGSRYHHLSENFTSFTPNQRLRNKWLVVYTLLKNPSLVQFRKRYRVVILERKEIDQPVIAREEAAIPSVKIPYNSKMDVVNLSI